MPRGNPVTRATEEHVARGAPWTGHDWTPSSNAAHRCKAAGEKLQHDCDQQNAGLKKKFVCPACFGRQPLNYCYMLNQPIMWYSNIVSILQYFDLAVHASPPRL